MIYRKVIAINPGSSLVYNSLGTVFHELKNGEGGTKSYKQAIVLDCSADTHYKLGITLQALEKLQEAEESYRQATTLTTGFLEAHEKRLAITKAWENCASRAKRAVHVRLLNPSNIEDLSPDKCPDDLAFKLA